MERSPRRTHHWQHNGELAEGGAEPKDPPLPGPHSEDLKVRRTMKAQAPAPVQSSYSPMHTVRLSSGGPGDSQKVSSWPEEKIQVSVRLTPVPPLCWDYRNVHIVAWCHFTFVVLGTKPRALCMLGQVFYL